MLNVSLDTKPAILGTLLPDNLWVSTEKKVIKTRRSKIKTDNDGKGAAPFTSAHHYQYPQNLNELEQQNPNQSSTSTRKILAALHCNNKKKLHRNRTTLNTHTQPFYCSSGVCPGPPG